MGSVVSVSPERPPEVQADGSVVEYFGGDRHVKFRVEEGFTGAIGTEMEVTTGSGGGDCGYPFEVGRTYLVSASERQGHVYTGICSETAPIEEAGHLIDQYRRLKEGKRAPSVYGRLFEYAYDPFTFETIINQSLSDVSVRLSREGHEVSTKTDANGGFAFYDLPAGKYAVMADTPTGYALRAFKTDNSIRLDSGACVLANLEAIPTGAIRGIVTDEDGAPLRGVAAVLTRADNAEGESSRISSSEKTRTSWTDVRGRFEFTEVPDGDFQLEIRTGSNEKVRSPYKARRVAGGPSDSDSSISVRSGSTVDIGTVSLTSWGDQYRENFLVLWSDGTPAIGATVYSTSLPRSDESARSAGTVDRDGRATLPFLGEYQYEVSAEVECRNDWMRESAAVKVVRKSEIRLIVEGEKCEPKEEAGEE